MTSKIAWLHYLKKPFVLSMTMHLGILLLLVVFSQHFVPELPPVPDTLEAALVSRSSVNQLSNSASATTPPASSVPTPKPLPSVEENSITTPAPKKEIKEEFSLSTLKRFSIQSIINLDKIETKFFPSKKEEKYIRKEGKKKQKKDKFA